MMEAGNSKMESGRWKDEIERWKVEAGGLNLEGVS